MYVREARNRDEAWLLDHIEAMGLDDVAFRSRDYVVVVDEESDARAGFGRLRIHKGDERCCELTGVGVLEGWRGQGVGAHVVERLVRNADAEGFDAVYSITDQPGYLEALGFERVELAALPAGIVDRLEGKRETVSEDVLPLRATVDGFAVPQRLRERFKTAGERAPADDPDERPEDFGIDPDEATYKYDTGR